MSTGSTSADVFLAPVLAELRRRNSLGAVAGLGGAPLRDHGVDLFFDTTATASVGIVTSIATLFGHTAGAARAYRRTIEYFRKTKPALVILVDNPGVNLRVLSLAHACRIPVLYYVPPEVWGLTRWQLRAIARKATVIASILRSEGDAYAACGGNVRWLGHPTVDLCGTVARPAELDGRAPTIGLFPGSRRHELIQILPVLRGAAEIIRTSEPRARFVMCSANELSAGLIREHLQTWSTPVELVHRQSHSVLSRCDLLLTCSGTATLEAAIIGVPMVVMYRLGWADTLTSILLSEYPYFAMPNYLLGRGIVPEVHSDQANPRRVADEGLALLRNPARRREVCFGLADVRRILGPSGAVGRVADLVDEMLNGAGPPGPR